MDDLSLKFSGGYTSLPASHLPGSVPAAVDGVPRASEFGGPSALPDVGGEHNAQPSNGWKGVFSIATYRPYFNVDTYVVVERIIGSLYPHKGDFIRTIADNPDMYGPVWISTTLVFLATVLGNFAAYLSFEPSSTVTEWVYDINYVNWAAAIFYAYICLVPLGCYFLLQYLGISLSLVEIWCLYGYSLFIFVPASFLLIIPTEILRHLVLLFSSTATLSSGDYAWTQEIRHLVLLFSSTATLSSGDYAWTQEIRHLVLLFSEAETLWAESIFVLVPVGKSWIQHFVCLQALFVSIF